MQDTRRIVEQRVGIDLPQLVAGIVLENVRQRLGVVAGWRKAGARQRVGDLLAEQRNIYRRAAVGSRRKKTDEAPKLMRPSLGKTIICILIGRGLFVKDKHGFFGLDRKIRLSSCCVSGYELRISVYKCSMA